MEQERSQFEQLIQQLIQDLNHPERSLRLEALGQLAQLQGKMPALTPVREANNHIHTFYSFSPYSPAQAVWLSHRAGLETAGIMDHDSISGAEEFIAAGRIVGQPTTIGLECRVHFSDTPLEGRRINHPDQHSMAYIALHGIPHSQIEQVRDYMAPYQEQRNRRNRGMIAGLNKMLEPHALSLDFQREVVPLSLAAQGGSITERHLLFALARKLIDKLGRGRPLISFLEEVLHLPLSRRVRGYLEDSNNTFYAYDLLGVLKSDLVPAFYLPAEAECPTVREILAFSKKIGAIPAYAYLGDITESVTGDKKSQAFEDAYLDLLFATLKELGFQAMTYMPTRNSLAQLRRVKKLCRQMGFLQISGVDINSPRQSFTCPVLREPEFRNLIDTTWALIGHERAASESLEAGMFSPTTVQRIPDLNQRIQLFKALGREYENQGSATVRQR